MKLPERINRKWMVALPNDDLLKAEKQLHVLFNSLEREEKKVRGSRYDLLRGPDTLLAAWQRWSQVNSMVRSRGLVPTYRP